MRTRGGHGDERNLAEFAGLKICDFTVKKCKGEVSTPTTQRQRLHKQKPKYWLCCKECEAVAPDLD